MARQPASAGTLSEVPRASAREMPARRGGIGRWWAQHWLDVAMVAPLVLYILFFMLVPVVQSIYESLPYANFSSGLLQRKSGRVGVMELKDVLWSDWGRPERIAESIRSIGATPAFGEAQPAVAALSTTHSARWPGSPDLTRVARSPGRSSNASVTVPVGVV